MANHGRATTDDPESLSPLLANADSRRHDLSSSTPRHATMRSLKIQRYVLQVVAPLAFVGVLVYTAWTLHNHVQRGDVERSAWPTDVGYSGPTPTGSEALAAATGYPSNFDSYPLAPPQFREPFNLLDHLGNLSPWKTVSHGLNSTAEIPHWCTVDEVHLLHRHGARYPTTGPGPAQLAAKLAKSDFKPTGNLEFLKNWTYKLGAEVLTPFGRDQLFSLGVGHRIKYGHLLTNGGRQNRKPVFRTESQDRMLKSALNFAAGFFGIPYDDKYHQLITIEAVGFNNTLAPYMTCKNCYRSDLNIGPAKMREWTNVYLSGALKRIQKDLASIDLTVGDVYNMQQMCAYEIVALGASSFCDLFTVEEWEGFEYSLDLQFWYSYSFGHPAQAAAGLGWVQEFISRVTKVPITDFNSTTNATLHTGQYFPLEGQNLFVDATHDTIISAVITTLNLTSFARGGPLPSTHIPKNRSFVTSKISPFAANLQAQIMTCDSSVLRTTSLKSSDRYIRWVLNDGVVPLSGVEDCGDNEEGLCPLDTFIASTVKRTSEIDWAYDCLSDYQLGDKPIVDGRPLKHHVY